MNNWKFQVNKVADANQSEAIKLFKAIAEEADEHWEDQDAGDLRHCPDYYSILTQVLDGYPGSLVEDVSPDIVKEVAKMVLEKAIACQMEDMDEWERIIRYLTEATK